MFAKLFGMLIAFLLIAAPLSGDAQVMLATGGGGETSAPIELNSPEAVREMVSQMSDSEVRKVLLERLDAVAAAAAEKEVAASADCSTLLNGQPSAFWNQWSTLSAVPR